MIANAEAWEQAHREGRRKALNNRVGFVRSQIEQKCYTLDAEAESQRQKHQGDARQGEEQRKIQHHNEQIEQVFAGLSSQERDQLKERVLDEMRARDPRRAEYYKKLRPQDEPLRSLISNAALAESEGEPTGHQNPADRDHKTYSEGYRSGATLEDRTIHAQRDDPAGSHRYNAPTLTYLAGDGDDISLTTAVSGDADGDGVAGILDHDLLLANWGDTVTPSQRSAGVLDGDGMVGQDDLDLVLAYWGNNGMSGPQVPEPGSAAVWGVIALALTHRRPR